MDKQKEYNMENIYEKEMDLSEEEIEGYETCTARTQRCLTDCPWPFGGIYISSAD